jgi:hypothetical protein
MANSKGPPAPETEIADHATLAISMGNRIAMRKSSAPQLTSGRHQIAPATRPSSLNRAPIRDGDGGLDTAASR